MGCLGIKLYLVSSPSGVMQGVGADEVLATVLCVYTGASTFPWLCSHGTLLHSAFGMFLVLSC